MLMEQLANGCLFSFHRKAPIVLSCTQILAFRAEKRDNVITLYEKYYYNISVTDWKNLCLPVEKATYLAGSIASGLFPAVSKRTILSEVGWSDKKKQYDVN